MATNQQGEITFSREQLYERLWEQPASHLAKELGASELLLIEVCKEYEIPKPCSGYWTKVRYGKKAEKIPLPECDSTMTMEGS